MYALRSMMTLNYCTLKRNWNLYKLGGTCPPRPALGYATDRMPNIS